MIQKFLTPGVRLNIINNSAVTPLPTGLKYLGLFQGNRGPDIRTYTSSSELQSFCGPENPTVTRGLSSVYDLLTQSNNVLAVRITRPLPNPTTSKPISYDSYSYVSYDNLGGWTAPTKYLGDPLQHQFSATEVFSIFGLGIGNYYNDVSVSLQWNNVQNVYIITVYNEGGVAVESFSVTFTITEDGSNMENFAENVINGSSKYIQILCNYEYIKSQQSDLNPTFRLNPSFNNSYNIANVNYNILNSNKGVGSNPFAGFSTCSDSSGNLYLVGGTTITGTTNILTSTNLPFSTVVYQYNIASKTWFVLPNNSASFTSTFDYSFVGPVSWYSPLNGGSIFSLTASSNSGTNLILNKYSLTTYQWSTVGAIDASTFGIRGNTPSAIFYNNSVNIAQPLISYISTGSTPTACILALDEASYSSESGIIATVNVSTVELSSASVNVRCPELIQFVNPISNDSECYAVCTTSSGAQLFQLSLDYSTSPAIRVNYTETSYTFTNVISSDISTSYVFTVTDTSPPIVDTTTDSTNSIYRYTGNTTLDYTNSMIWLDYDGYTLIALVNDNLGQTFVTSINLNTSVSSTAYPCINIKYTLNWSYNSNSPIQFPKPGIYQLGSYGICGLMGSSVSSGTSNSIAGAFYFVNSIGGQSQLYNGTSLPKSMLNTSDVTNSIAPLYNMEIYPQIDLICDSGFNDTPSMTLALNNLGTKRQDAEVIVSIPKAYQYSENSAVQYRNSLNINNGYSFLVTPGEYVRINNYTGAYGYFPISGAVSANFAKNDYINGPWQTPAGPTNGLLSLVVKLPPSVKDTPLSVKYKELSYSNTDLLAGNQVNFVGKYNSVFPGNYLKTDYTLSSASDSLQSVGVRRTTNYIATQCAQIAVSFLYQPNNAQTRETVQETFNRFLSIVQSAPGALYSYSVVCNDTNNTPVTISNNLLIVDISITPQSTIKGIILNVTVNNLESSVTVSQQ